MSTNPWQAPQSTLARPEQAAWYTYLPLLSAVVACAGGGGLLTLMLFPASLGLHWALVGLGGMALILLGYAVSGCHWPSAAMLVLLHAVALGMQVRAPPTNQLTCLVLAALLLLHGLSGWACWRQRHTRPTSQASATEAG
ncbi:hypothetical protein [Leeia aquatica]|uniref:Uncharacterized protein n=1 Tax=Leeia aquatica TaxID=2725557 RepID=A0A847SEU2_9NEIS|nr:hypothetical protein [Leeia aquatica]NLR75728.1 hypothetical protein [Leeia aquatica]